MKTSPEPNKSLRAGVIRQAHRRKQAEEVLIDPDTNRPVVRDLRFDHFVAHERHCYFLNQTSDH